MPTAKVTYDEALLAELVSLRFVEAHRHVTIVGPVGVGKTFIAHALGHIACRRGFTVLALRADRLLKMLKHARLDHSHEAELRKLLAIDVLIIDDFCLDTMDAIESRDVHEILTERDRAGSVIITSNRGPDEWIATFADPVRAQAAIDRFNSNAYDLLIEGESYRKRLKPKSPTPKLVRADIQTLIPKLSSVTQHTPQDLLAPCTVTCQPSRCRVGARKHLFVSTYAPWHTPS